MNGNVQPTKVVALRTKTVFSLLHGTTVEVTKGDEVDGWINEHGNVYNQDQVYIGSTPLDFEVIS